MRKHSVVIIIILLSYFASHAQTRYKSLSDNIKNDFIYLEYVSSEGKGWSNMSKEKQGAILNLVDDCKEMSDQLAFYERKKEQSSNKNDIEIKKDNEAQMLAIQIATNIKKIYLLQKLSSISTEYLATIKQQLKDYKGEKNVKECIKDIDSIIVWVKAYNDMDRLLNQPFNKPLVTNTLIRASHSFNGLKARNKSQYDEFVKKYWQLYYYEASIKLFQNLIKSVNNDAKMKTYRASGDDYLFEALVRYVNIWKGLDNKKYEEKEKNIFQLFILDNPYLSKKYQQYHMNMIANPTQQNTTLENEILQIKTN